MFRNFWTVCPIAAFAVGLSLGISPALSAPSPKDVLKKGWEDFATDYCLKDLKKQFSERHDEGPDRSAVAEVVKSGAWLFAEDRATVHFTVYSIASFAAGEFDVDIPYKVLKPYAQVDAPFL